MGWQSWHARATGAMLIMALTLTSAAMVRIEIFFWKLRAFTAVLALNWVVRGWNALATCIAVGTLHTTLS